MIKDYQLFKELPLNVKYQDDPHHLRKKSFLTAQRLAEKYANLCSSRFSFHVMRFFFNKEQVLEIFSKSLFKELLFPSFDLSRLLFYKDQVSSEIDIPIHDKVVWEFLKEDSEFKHINFKFIERVSFIKRMLSPFLLLFDLWKLFVVIFIKSSDDESKIATEICDGVDYELGRSEINWFPYIDSPEKKSVLFAIDTNNDELSVKENFILKSFKEAGGTLTSESESLIAATGAHKIRIPRERRLSFLGSSTNLLQSTLYWILIYKFWYSIYKKYRVNTLLMLAESPIDSLLQKAALEKLGGYMLTRQRSELASILGYKYQPGHIGLFWTDDGHEHFNKIVGNNIEYGFTIGHAFIDRQLISQYKKQTDQIIADFKEITPNPFIISLFDNVHGSYLEVTTEEIKLMLQLVLSFVRDHAHVCLIIKSKKLKTILPYLSKENQDFCQNSKRIAFFYGNYLPLILCMASDLSIGVGASSSVWEGNILGKRGIHFWPSPDLAHVFHKINPRKFIVRTAEELRDAILSIIHGTSGAEELGLTSEKDFHLFDKYSDGLGPQRTALILELCRNKPKSLSRKDFYPVIEEKLKGFNMKNSQGRLSSKSFASADSKSSKVSISTDEDSSIS